MPDTRLIAIKYSLILMVSAAIFGAVFVPILVALPWLVIFISWAIWSLLQENSKGTFIPGGFAALTVMGSYWGAASVGAISCVTVLVPTVILRLKKVLSDTNGEAFLAVVGLVVALAYVSVGIKINYPFDYKDLMWLGFSSLSGFLSGWLLFFLIRGPLERLVETLSSRPAGNV